MPYAYIKIERKKMDMDLVLDEELNKLIVKEEKLANAAPQLLALLESLTFIAESVAHLKGLEREILPTTELARNYIKEFK
jgi:hypothetical protein